MTPRSSPAGAGLPGLLLAALLLLPPPARGQAQMPLPSGGQGAWQAHTAMHQVTDLDASDQEMWVATAGGLFSVVPGTREVTGRFSPVEGLHRVDPQAVAVDRQRGAVWIGYRDGFLDRLGIEDRTVRSYRDISRAEQFSDRSVRGLLLMGDSLLVATGFGLVVFDPVKGEVRDAYTRFGSIPTATPVRDVLVAPLPDGVPGLWVATDQGLARAPLTPGINLREPSAWTVETTLPDPRARSLAYFDGRIVAGTEVDAYRRTAEGGWERLGFSGEEVKELVAAPERLFGIERFSLVSLDRAGGVARYAAGNAITPTAVALDAGGTLWLGDAVEGAIPLGALPAGGGRVEDARAVIPSGPDHQLFSELDFDAAGNLWAASAEGSGSGFYRYAPAEDEWTSFTARRVPELAGRTAFKRLAADRFGNVWMAGDGYGLVRITPEGAVEVYDRTNSSLLPAGGDPNFVIVSDVATEAGGTLWAVNKFTALPLHARTPDGSWKGYSHYVGGGLGRSVRYERVFVDAFGRKWITVLPESGSGGGLGLVVVDTKDTPADASDDVFRYFRDTGSPLAGLPDDLVTVVAENAAGSAVWIGTAAGLAYVPNPGVILLTESAIERPRQEGRAILRDLYVNDLAVDPAGQVWVATRAGAWLIRESPAGFEIAREFNAQNSPLFSDNVVSVEVDARTGRVYFATDRGLLSWQGDATAPAPQKQELFVFPNPVRPGPDGFEAPVRIDGLVDETDLRILTPAGELVASFPTRGGRAQWDGRDLNGRPVPSGVYLIVAVGRNGEGAAYGKVAVVR